MQQYLIARASEPSTWRGLVFVLTALGVPLAPALAEHVVATGLAVSGLIGMLTADK